jgi:hypothetical protein
MNERLKIEDLLSAECLSWSAAECWIALPAGLATGALSQEQEETLTEELCSGGRRLRSSPGRSSVQRAEQWRRAQWRCLRRCVVRPRRAVGVGYLAPCAAWADMLLLLSVRVCDKSNLVMAWWVTMPQCLLAVVPLPVDATADAIRLCWARLKTWGTQFFLPNLRVGRWVTTHPVAPPLINHL